MKKETGTMAIWAIFFSLVVLAVLFAKPNDPNGKEPRKVSQAEYVNPHQVTAKEAQEYKDQWTNATAGQKLDAVNSYNYLSYDADAVRDMLESEGISKVRFYPALHNGTYTMVITGVDKNGNQIGKVLQKGSACPPYCDDKLVKK